MISRSNQLTGIAILAAYLVVAMWAIHPEASPLDALPLGGSARQVISELLPQGWSFFDRNPHETQYVPYIPDHNGQWKSMLQRTNGDPAYMFGWDRRGRVRGIELEEIIHRLPESSWHACGVLSAVQCLDALRGSSAPKLTNAVIGRTLCGQVGVAESPTVSLTADSSETASVTRAVLLNVQC